MPLTLTDRELDAAIAEKVMGQEICVCENMKRITTSTFFNPQTGRCNTCVKKAPISFSTDRNTAALVLERIRELGLTEKLVNTLSPTLPRTNSYLMQVWTHMVATPRQLMEAALAAVEKAAVEVKA